MPGETTPNVGKILTWELDCNLKKEEIDHMTTTPTRLIVSRALARDFPLQLSRTRFLSFSSSLSLARSCSLRQVHKPHSFIYRELIASERENSRDGPRSLPSTSSKRVAPPLEDRVINWSRDLSGQLGTRSRRVSMNEVVVLCFLPVSLTTIVYV